MKSIIRIFATISIVITILLSIGLFVQAAMPSHEVIERTDPTSNAGPAKPIDIKSTKPKSKSSSKPTYNGSVSSKVPSKQPTKSKPKTTPKCPKGTMNIGSKTDPACKIIPTGCPYGDSVPMEYCYDNSDSLTDK